MNRRLYLLLAVMLALGLALTACGGGDSGDKEADTKPAPQATEPSQSTGDAAKGKETYAQACAGCHGPNGEGVEGLGKAWTTSAFIRDSSDDELLAFIKTGRPIGDPANTTGVDMPPKGGNPALTDEDLQNMVAFMRTLQ